MVIDAETGIVLIEDVRPEDRSEFEAVLDTLKVGPLDTVRAPWPYTAEISADLVRETGGGVSYLKPSPETGLQITGGIGDPNGPFIGMTNGLSSLIVNTANLNGSLSVDWSNVDDGDRPVFERWLGELKICGVESAC